MKDCGPTTAALADFASGLRWDDVPGTVRHEAKRALVNFFGCALAGSRDLAVQIAGRVYQRHSPQGASTVIGGRSTDALHAASLNAMSANAHDFDDTHMPTFIHPTAPVAPAALAASEALGLSGQDTLLAVALGLEVACRLGNAMPPAHYERGWHITSTCGIFGAAAAAGRAIGLDSRGMVWALGSASALSSGLVETLGSMSKNLGVGSAASNGLLCAYLAAEGFEGPASPLEGKRGFLPVFGDGDSRSLVQGLGARWDMLSITYKPYPCGVVLNPVIEACLDLRAEHRIDASDVMSVEIRGHPLLRQRADRPHVTSGRASQVCGQHAAAVALTRGRAGLEEFSDAAVADAALRTLAGRVAFVDDDSFGLEAAQVSVELRGGATWIRRIDQPRGGLARPLLDEELDAKLRDLARFSGLGVCVSRLSDALWDFENVSRAGDVLALVGMDCNSC